jgi:hypothetical protein
LFSILFCLGCASAQSATVADLVKITGNMGGIGLNGLPKLSFEIADQYDARELAALGFDFKLTHQTKLRHGRTAKTEWSLPCLQTCAYIDTGGDVMWLTTSGQIVRFRKTEHGYARNKNGAVVKVTPESNTVEITTPAPASIKWRYRNGFLENIDNQKYNYSVVTDRGTILSISKTILNREIPLLKCAYSARNGLEELEFHGGRKYRLLWAADHTLMAVDDTKGRRFDFEYANSLLTCWTKASGPRNELKWRHLDYVRETAFQIPPVLLREDASCSYVYALNKWGNVTGVKIHDKAGTLVSDTRIGTTGMEQVAPRGKTRRIFK